MPRSSPRSVLEDKEWLPVEVFLWLDPLVGLTTAVAARHWNVALLGMGGILLVCLLFPRGFCGYICPLGTLLDGFDWLIGRRITRWRVQRPGGWVHLKYYLLTAVLIGAFCGVLLSGYVAAIPVLTRGLLFTGGTTATGTDEGMESGRTGAGERVPVAAVVRHRVSPGAVRETLLVSVRVSQRGGLLRVQSPEDRGAEGGGHVYPLREMPCALCPFDAIRPDYTTRTLDCSLLPDLWRHVSDPRHQVRHALES